jgi:TatD DNase family protein
MYMQPNNVIDSHFHLLEMEKRGIDPSQFLAQLNDTDVAGGMDIGISADDIDRRIALTAPYPQIRLSAGIGPWGAQGEQDLEQMVNEFAQRITGKSVDAIGEIGLDWYWNYGSVDRQLLLFQLQLALARHLALPVVIHTRDADRSMIEVLQSSDFPRGGIIHCFSGSWELAKAALDRGLHISFAGTITFKKNAELRDILARIPENRLLLETDSPYLAPVPYRGKTNTPLYMRHIYQTAAQVRSTSMQELADQIEQNFITLLPQKNYSG